MYSIGRRRRLPQRVARHDRHAPDRLRGRGRLRDPGRQQRLARRGRAVAGRDPRPPLLPHPPGRDRARRADARRERLVFVVGGLLTVVGSRAGPRGPAQRSARRRSPRLARRSPRLPDADPGACARQVALGSGAVALVALVGGGVLLVLPVHADRHPHPAGDPAGPVLLHRRGRARHHVPVGRHRDRRHRLDEARAAGDRLLREHRHRPGADRRARHHAARRLGHRGRRLDRRPDQWPRRRRSRTATAAASVAVDPAAAAALLSRHYAEIGGAGGGATLTVTPVVAMTGRAEGRSFTAGSPAGLRLRPGRRLPAAGRGGVRLVRAPRSKANIQRLSCTFCVVPDRGLRLSEFQRIHWIHKRG